MARSEARLQFGCWRSGLAGLNAHEKLLYCVLLTEPTLNHCGVGAVRLTRWAKDASLSMRETEKALAGLCEGEWVLVDDDTEELFVRSLIRNDGVANQPYVLKGALREAVLTSSPRIRVALAAELRKLPPRQEDGVSKAGKPVTYPDPHATADVLDPPGSPKPTRKAPETLFESLEKGSETLHGGGGGGGDGGGTSTPVATQVQEPLSSAKPPRLDVERLCGVLADRIGENTGDRPTINKQWQDAARLLLDKDLAREPDPLGLALRLAEWTTSNEFWRTNVLSMPKFRQQFTQLRMKARYEWEQSQRSTQAKTRTRDDKRAAVDSVVAEVFGTSALQPDLRSIQGGRP